VAGDDPCALAGQGQRAVGGGDEALERAAARQVHERVHAVEEEVAHVDDAGPAEMDDGVAVGVGGRHVEGVDVVAVDMQGHGVVEGHHRKRLRRRGRELHAHRLDELLGAQAEAHVVVGHDEGPRLAEVLVPAGVVGVPVGVEDETHGPVADRGHRRLDLGCHGRPLVVDEEDAVGSRGDADVASRARQHPDALRHLLRLDLDLLEIGALRARGRRQRRHKQYRDGHDDSASHQCSKRRS